MSRLTKILIKASLLYFCATASIAAPIDAPLPLETQPFGALTLVQEIDTSTVLPQAQKPAGASTTNTLLGRTARTLNMSTEPKAISYRIGQNMGLVAGATYVLEIEYPDDQPRSFFIANRGADFVRGFSTGTAIGDARLSYTPSTLESLNYPQSQTWKSYRQLFVLHERTSLNFTTQRNQMCAARSLLPADGFDVVLFQSYDRNDPRSTGAAFGKIKLWRVNSATITAPTFTPLPASLKQRHLYWREEMADEAASGATVEKRAFNDPLNWYDAKMTLAQALGFDTIGKDLLEWGHNQGWDSKDPDWINNPGNPTMMSDWKTIWPRIVERAGQRGLNVIPYYEYSGSIGGCGSGNCGVGYKSLGLKRRVSPLFPRGNNFYTGVDFSENAAVDITDPDAVTDLRKIFDATIGANSTKANILGAWLRTRPTDIPISFTAETIARYNAGNPSAPRTLQQMRDDVASRDAYYAWWYTQRKNYLTGMRDYLRQSTGNSQMQVLFSAYPQEPVPNSYSSDTSGYVNLVTDDPTWWSSYRSTLKDNWFQYNWYTTSPASAVSTKIHDLGLKRFLVAASGAEEIGHAVPPADPERYTSESGVAMSYPYGTGLFTVSDAGTLSRFTNGEGGQFLTKHYPLNEDNGGPVSLQWDWTTMSCAAPYPVVNEHPFRGIVGYTSVAVDREGAHSMLAEARSLANGNPFHIAYLESSSFSRGFPEYVRRFNAALRSLPAVASTTVANATTTADIVVRAYATPSDGTYYAVINTALNSKPATTVTLPGTGVVTDLLKNATLASGELRFDLYPGEVRTFKVATNSTPSAAITLAASQASIAAGQQVTLTASPSVTNTAVSSVNFFAGSNMLSTSNVSPYTFTVSPTSATSYTARVNTTTSGLTATSNTVNVSVSAAPTAQVSLASSASAITAGQSITLTAAPTVSNTTISSVEFFAGSTLLGSDTTAPYTWSASPASTTSYTVRVNTATSGLSATSSAVTVTVSTAPISTVKATAESATKVNLSWSAIAGATGYDIERAIQNGRFVARATTAANVTTFADAASNSTTGAAPNFTVVSNIVTAGTRYTYRVRARTASGTTDWSQASATTPGDTLSASKQDAIEFRYTKPTTDGAYQWAPMNTLYALVYLPPGYSNAANATRNYPVVIFRHGLGQFGSGRDKLALQYASDAKGTPPYKAANDASFTPDVIIVSPQLPWNYDENSDEEERLMKGLRSYIESNYRAMPNAINVTGLSAGTGSVVRHAARGGLPLASWSVISNQGLGKIVITASEFARAANIANWHASNLGVGGDFVNQGSLISSLIANGGKLSTDGGKIVSQYFCDTPTITTTDPQFSCTKGGDHNAWGKAYTFDNAYQNPNFWQWVATQRSP